MKFSRACKRIFNHYGKDNVAQISKPDHLTIYIVDFVDGSGIVLKKKDLLKM